MMSGKKLLIFLISFFINSGMFAQFKVEIQVADTNVCTNDTVLFTAKTTNAGITQSEVTYTWNFDDGTADKTGLDLDTIKYLFSKGKGYVVRVKAKKTTNSDIAYQKMQVALTANFSGTKTDRLEPICLGQTVGLTGVISPVSWKHEPDKSVEENPVKVDNSNLYSSDFDYRIFNKSDIVASAGDIDTVGVKLEHSNLNDVKIELICPEGNVVVLKDFGGADKYFGIPVDADTDESGVGYWYYWTNNPNQGSINSSVVTGASLPSDSYTPEQSFSNFIGCSLNGVWTLKITDNKNSDNGFVFESRLKFNNTLLPPEWSFTNTYSKLIWSGPGVSATLPSGISNAIPTTIGNSEYKFQVTDNFTCKQDTSLFVQVSGASFTANPTEGNFDLDVSFTNTTSWATEFLWDFGDNTATSNEESPTHTYVYPDGRYIVSFTATTDDGCKDTDTTTITVTIPDAVFNDPPNAFSPNGDGMNDNLIFDVDNFQTFECWIYSRWGKLVKKIETLDEAKSGWDGKINGSNSEASPGIYFFYVRAVDYFGQEVSKKGSFQLFK